MTKQKLLIFFSLAWTFGCEPVAKKAVINSKESVSEPFNFSSIGADIDSSVLVESMTVLEIKALLSNMFIADQQYRDSIYNGNKDRSSFYIKKMSKNDEANLLLLSKIVRKYGWPAIDLFGEKGAETAWLIIWHHRTDREILSEYIGFIEVAKSKGQISLGYYNSIRKQLDFLEASKL